MDPLGKKFKSGKVVEKYLKENSLSEEVKCKNEYEMDHLGDQEGKGRPVSGSDQCVNSVKTCGRRPNTNSLSFSLN